MKHAVLALSHTTAHGLPRVVADKPKYVRIIWLLLYLCMLGMFLKNFSEFVVRLRSGKVTTSIVSEDEPLQFPDIYMCLENPISGSYSKNIDAGTVRALHASFNVTIEQLRNRFTRENYSEEQLHQRMIQNSMMQLHGLPYKLLFDTLAHRSEQSLISSSVIYIQDSGSPTSTALEPAEFNHPLYLRCLQWAINDTWKSKILTEESWAGLTVTLLLDTNSSLIESRGSSIEKKVYIEDGTIINPSDWSLSLNYLTSADRVAGVKLFLCPPGEYPSEFVTSFTLGPGKYHSVDMKMTNFVSAVTPSNCLDNQPDVQFWNPYDGSPYTHAYSYSYCYYYEYHQLAQRLLNVSGAINPLPWPLRNRNFLYNLTNIPNYLTMEYSKSVWVEVEKFTENVRSACKSRRPCSTIVYSDSVSSADWPTSSSLGPFLNSSVRKAWMKAKAKNLSVPVLDFLMTGNASSVATYVFNNLLKVHLRLTGAAGDRITFSVEYGFSNFISEVGGIMGIYLGMSLLTLCELLELLHNLLVLRRPEKAKSVVQDGGSAMRSSSTAVLESVGK